MQAGPALLSALCSRWSRLLRWLWTLWMRRRTQRAWREEHKGIQSEHWQVQCRLGTQTALVVGEVEALQRVGRASEQARWRAFWDSARETALSASENKRTCSSHWTKCGSLQRLFKLPVPLVLEGQVWAARNAESCREGPLRTQKSQTDQKKARVKRTNIM